MKKILTTFITIFALSNVAQASFIEFTDSNGNTSNVSIFEGTKTAEKFFKKGINKLFPIANQAFIYFYDSAVDGLTFNMIISDNQDNRDDKFFSMDFLFSGNQQPLSLVHVNDHNSSNQNPPEVMQISDTLFEGRWKYSTNKDGLSIGGIGEGTSVDFNFLRTNPFLTDIMVIGASGESVDLSTNIMDFNNNAYQATVVSDPNVVSEPKSVTLILLFGLCLLCSRRAFGHV